MSSKAVHDHEHVNGHDNADKKTSKPPIMPLRDEMVRYQRSLSTPDVDVSVDVHVLVTAVQIS
ncbi:MAG TPA: hypothetical protein VGQ81_01060 [Acidobacteriota bacterium]|nr:hypothetical protein [Acidobacteriota bacterium]